MKITLCGNNNTQNSEEIISPQKHGEKFYNSGVKPSHPPLLNG
jgi:hypothetical protein